MLLGEIGVGKTSLARRLVFDSFESDYKATIGVDIYTHTVRVSGGSADTDCALVIWDVDGDFGESILQHTYIRGASGALIIADASRSSTFGSMLMLAEGFQRQLPGRPLVLVLNKIDLMTEPGRMQVPQAFASTRAPVFEASAKDGRNVTGAFVALAKAILERQA